MMIGARTACWGGGKSDPYHGYVSDGLICYFDGIDNVCLGDENHVNQSDTWIDLTGNGYTLVKPNDSTAYFSDYGVTFNNGENDYFKYGNVSDIVKSATGTVGTNYTFEYVYSKMEGADGCGVIGLRTLQSYNEDSAVRLVFGSGTGVQDYMWGVREIYNVNDTLRSMSYSAHDYTVPNVKAHCDVRYSINGNAIVEKIDLERTPLVEDGFKIRIGNQGVGGMNVPWKGIFHSIRLYNRILLPEEVDYNYANDKARFGIS